MSGKCSASASVCLWAHDRHQRTLPLSSDAIEAILVDFGGLRHTLDGPAQGVLRTLYRQRAWISCGCRPEAEAPLWVLATRAQRVYLRQNNDASHASGCPLSRRHALSDAQVSVTTRSEIRKRRWHGPARILHARQPGDSPHVECLASGQRVLRSHLMQRLLRDLMHRGGMDRTEVESLMLGDGRVLRSGTRFEHLKERLADTAGVCVQRGLGGVSYVQPRGPVDGELPHTCVMALVEQIGSSSATRSGGWILVDATRRQVALPGPPGQDAAAPDPVGPWLVLIVVEHREGANHLIDASVLPVFAPNLILPINHAADRPGLLAALIGARAARRRGVADLALSALLFADPVRPDVDRDGVYVIEGPATLPLYLSRHPGPTDWIDLSLAPRRITQAVIARLVPRAETPGI